MFSILAIIGLLSAASLADSVAATTTAMTATSCAAAALLPTHPAGIHCGHHGRLAAAAPLGEPSVAALEQCAGLCVSNSSCRSIGFSEADSTCQMYSRRLAYQGYQNMTQDLGMVFFARGCWSCPSNNVTTGNISVSSISSVTTSLLSASSFASESMNQVMNSDTTSTTSFVDGGLPTTSLSTGHSLAYSAFPSGTNEATANLSSADMISTSSASATELPSISPTATSTETVTTTVTTTVYPASSDPINSCESISVGNDTWYLYYSGSGYTESPSNPGNDQANVVAPISVSLSGNFSTDCAAVQSCADGAASSPPDTYYSFDLHFLQSTNQWQCVLYYDGNIDPTYFSVVDSDVARAYGFTYSGNT